jgi:hypothetical protein
MVALGARFDSVPMVIGDWKGTALELPADARAMAGADAYVHRRYSNPSRGMTISVLLLGGLPGKISTHTPDVCYTGAGYTLDAPASIQLHYGPTKVPAEFRSALATKQGTSPSVLRIFWSWNDSKAWSAPDEPRWKFATAEALCKLYVVRETAGAVVDPGAEPCNEFMNLLLPELDRLVFSTPNQLPPQR